MPYVDIADKTTLDKIYNILSADGVFGFIEHMDILSPLQRVEYIGMNANYTPLVVTKGGGYSLNSWTDFPWLKANKPYMVKSDGTPDYRLNENDYTKKEDGTDSDVSNTSYDGGAFAWAMKIYKYEKTVGSDRIVRFSFEKRYGYEPIGFIDPDNNELEGVWIPMFYGSIVDSKMKCISGTQPCYDNTTSAEKTAIDNFGSRAKFFGGAIVQTLIDLMIMFAKTTNLQEAYGNGNMSGHDSSLAPTNGVKQNAVVGGGQFYGTSGNVAMKCFHIENFYGDCWNRIEGCVTDANKQILIKPTPTYNTAGTGYTATGIIPGGTSGGYINAEEGKAYGLIPKTASGSETTYIPDGLWFAASCYALVGGSCDYGLPVGPFALALDGAVSGSGWAIGAALSCQQPTA